MDRLFIDTDVAIDFLLDREPFSADAARVFDLFERGQAEGFISALAMNNIHYIVRKVLGKEATKQILKQLIELVEVQGVSRTNVLDALSSDFSDFEDGMQHAAAHEINNLRAIITRNVKDYQTATLPVMTPTDYLAQR